MSSTAELAEKTLVANTNDGLKAFLSDKCVYFVYLLCLESSSPVLTFRRDSASWFALFLLPLA